MNLLGLLKAVPFGQLAEKGYWLYTKAPRNFLDGMEAENFRKTVRFCAERSPFYRRKFKELSIDPAKIKNPSDLGGFFTTTEDLRVNPHDFVCGPYDTAYETTGTTSKKTKRVYFSRSEVREAGFAGAVGLWGLGVRKDDRVASAFDYSFWVSGPVLSSSCETLGCFHVEAGRLDPVEFYDRLADYGITVIVGDPSWIVRLSEIAEKKQALHKSAGGQAWPVKLLLGGGENLTEEARRYVEKVWKADFILSYGQTEAFGAIGMETRDKAGYHLNEFHNYFEIINPDAQGYGELVYTNLNRRVMPLIRYRSGDITRYLEGPSPSGLPGRRIEKLKGRVDEWTVTAMGNIAPWMFESVFRGIPGVGDWQIVVDKEGTKDIVRFCFESSGAENGLKEKVLEHFKKEFAPAYQMAEMGLLKLEVTGHPTGTLRGGDRKLRRIVDKRVF